MIRPIIDVPLISDETNVSNDARFDEPLASDIHSKVHKFNKKDSSEFIKDYKNLTLTNEEKKELKDTANNDIEWVKRKLKLKLRKPMWQDENNPRSKEKLIRMFNKYVQKRLDLIKCLEEG
jgi:hypothetical protein